MKKDYIIRLQGCDDCTYLKMNLTLEEFELIYEIGLKTLEVSKCSCMPTLHIKEV